MGYVLNVYLFIRILSVKGGYLFHLFINRTLVAVTPSFTYSICHPPSYLVDISLQFVIDDRIHIIIYILWL